MSTITRKPPIKETVGAQYICFNNMSEDEDWTENFETEVEKTETVKSVKVTENLENTDVYGSGKVYDTDTSMSFVDIEVNALAFPTDTVARMRAESVDGGGLILSGGSGTRPYFAYGKVVKMKKDNFRYEWFPKCKLIDNSDEIATREEKFSAQTDTITIRAYLFDTGDHVKTYVDSTATNFPEGLTEEKFFSKPILTAADLKSVTT